MADGGETRDASVCENMDSDSETDDGELVARAASCMRTPVNKNGKSEEDHDSADTVDNSPDDPAIHDTQLDVNNFDFFSVFINTTTSVFTQEIKDSEKTITEAEQQCASQTLCNSSADAKMRQNTDAQQMITENMPRAKHDPPPLPLQHQLTSVANVGELSEPRMTPPATCGSTATDLPPDTKSVVYFNSERQTKQPMNHSYITAEGSEERVSKAGLFVPNDPPTTAVAAPAMLSNFTNRSAGNAMDVKSFNSDVAASVQLADKGTVSHTLRNTQRSLDYPPLPEGSEHSAQRDENVFGGTEKLEPRCLEKTIGKDTKFKEQTPEGYIKDKKKTSEYDVYLQKKTPEEDTKDQENTTEDVVKDQEKTPRDPNSQEKTSEKEANLQEKTPDTDAKSQKKGLEKTNDTDVGYQEKTEQKDNDEKTSEEDTNSQQRKSENDSIFQEKEPEKDANLQDKTSEMGASCQEMTPEKDANLQDKTSEMGASCQEKTPEKDAKSKKKGPEEKASFQEKTREKDENLPEMTLEKDASSQEKTPASDAKRQEKAREKGTLGQEKTREKGAKSKKKGPEKTVNFQEKTPENDDNLPKMTLEKDVKSQENTPERDTKRQEMDIKRQGKTRLEKRPENDTSFQEKGPEKDVSLQDETPEIDVSYHEKTEEEDANRKQNRPENDANFQERRPKKDANLQDGTPQMNASYNKKTQELEETPAEDANHQEKTQEHDAKSHEKARAKDAQSSSRQGEGGAQLVSCLQTDKDNKPVMSEQTGRVQTTEKPQHELCDSAQDPDEHDTQERGATGTQSTALQNQQPSATGTEQNQQSGTEPNSEHSAADSPDMISQRMYTIACAGGTRQFRTNASELLDSSESTEVEHVSEELSSPSTEQPPSQLTREHSCEPSHTWRSPLATEAEVRQALPPIQLAPEVGNTTSLLPPGEQDPLPHDTSLQSPPQLPCEVQVPGNCIQETGCQRESVAQNVAHPQPIPIQRTFLPPTEPVQTSPAEPRCSSPQPSGSPHLPQTDSRRLPQEQSQTSGVTRSSGHREPPRRPAAFRTRGCARSRARWPCIDVHYDFVVDMRHRAVDMGQNWDLPPDAEADLDLRRQMHSLPQQVLGASNLMFRCRECCQPPGWARLPEQLRSILDADLMSVIIREVLNRGGQGVATLCLVCRARAANVHTFHCHHRVLCLHCVLGQRRCPLPACGMPVVFFWITGD